MDDEEKLLADQLYACIHEATHRSPRSMQAAAFGIGVSDIGTCHERTRRLLAQIPMADEPDKLEAFVGTAVGDHFEKAIKAQYPEVLVQAEVRTELKVGNSVFALSGHPDLIFPWGVGDIKTVDGLTTIERQGPTDQQRFQRHLYTKMAHEAGLLSVPLDQAKTFNVWVDRAGSTKHLHVEMDNYSEDVVAAAALWLEDVWYAYEHDETAYKDPPRQWCSKACGHFSTCRQFDSTVSGLITDERIIDAARQHEEGKEMAKQAKRLTEDAKKVLAAIEGYTPPGEDGKAFQIAWVHVNASEPTMGNGRRAYDRLEVTTIKR